MAQFHHFHSQSLSPCRRKLAVIRLILGIIMTIAAVSVISVLLIKHCNAVKTFGAQSLEWDYLRGKNRDCLVLHHPKLLNDQANAVPIAPKIYLKYHACDLLP